MGSNEGGLLGLLGSLREGGGVVWSLSETKGETIDTGFSTFGTLAVPAFASSRNSVSESSMSSAQIRMDRCRNYDLLESLEL